MVNLIKYNNTAKIGFLDIKFSVRHAQGHVVVTVSLLSFVGVDV